jgi:Family of unknown function (DUF6152)
LKAKFTSRTGRVLGAAILAAAAFCGPARAHHSFAIYNAEVTKVFTGVVTRVNPDANHLQIFFAPMTDDRRNVERDKDGKPIIWAVEMAGSAQSAKEGISVNSFPPGTIFSVGLHPLRSGDPAGSRRDTGSIFKCPPKTPPEAGKNCDSVAGMQQVGEGGPLPTPN